ncbi:MAG: low-complexity tail membrane protein [Coleofasciculaceae cyanobacterium]
MRSFWNEPFLWIHLAGIAALPLTLELVWLGLAVGDPILPVWLELLLVAAIGIVPVLWMQLTHPFDIFSILVIAIKPEQLSSEQQRILSLFQAKTNKLLTIGAVVFMLWLLWQIYRVAPLALAVAPLAPKWRIAGLLWAGVAFLMSNLFLQVPLSVAQVLLTSESEWAATQPYPTDKIPQDFTIPGLRVKRILPMAIADSSESSISSLVKEETKVVADSSVVKEEETEVIATNGEEGEQQQE